MIGVRDNKPVSELVGANYVRRTGPAYVVTKPQASR